MKLKLNKINGEVEEIEVTVNDAFHDYIKEGHTVELHEQMLGNELIGFVKVLLHGDHVFNMYGWSHENALERLLAAI
jgi:hypothetical protein